MPVTGSSQESRGTRTVGALVIGRGVIVKKVQSGTVSVDPANAGAAGAFETAVTITGVQVGDIVVFEPPSALEANLVYSGARVSADDTVQLRLGALASVNGANLSWRYLWYDLT